MLRKRHGTHAAYDQALADVREARDYAREMAVMEDQTLAGGFTADDLRELAGYGIADPPLPRVRWWRFGR
jgi:hypothetical protein